MSPDLEHGLSNLYQQTGDRKNWQNPSREEMIESLNKAHAVNKKIVENYDQAVVALIETYRQIDRMKIWIKILGVAVTVSWGVTAYVIKLLLPYAVKGMIK